MTHDPTTQRQAAPDAPPPGDSLRLVRLRLYLTIAAAAVLPLAVGSPLMRIFAGGPNGLQPVQVAALVALAALLVVLTRWMTHQILRPAAELEASRARLHRAYEEVREFALVDGLTGLGNHRSFQEEFESLLDQARRYRHELSLVLLDLDEFKQVNDAQGHAVGDELLAEVGRLLREQIRRADRAFRVGGDEFAILLPHTGADGAAQLARRVLATGLSVRAAASYARPISFSAGVVSYPEHAANREQLQLYADSAMYRGKRSGRTVVTVVDPALDGEHVDEQKRAALSEAVAQVIDERALRPVYQPLVHLETGRVIGFEGLIRPTPGSPFTNPGALFAAAEVGGRIVDLDLACLDVVIAGATAIPAPLLVTLNISPRTLEAPEFGAARLINMLDRAGFPPDRVDPGGHGARGHPRRPAGAVGARAMPRRRDPDRRRRRGRGQRRPPPPEPVPVRRREDRPLARPGGDRARHGAGRPQLAGRPRAALGSARRGRGRGDTRRSSRWPASWRSTPGQGYLLGRPGDRVDLERIDIAALLRPSDRPLRAARPGAARGPGGPAPRASCWRATRARDAGSARRVAPGLATPRSG